MEKIRFRSEEMQEEVDFFVLEQTKVNGVSYRSGVYKMYMVRMTGMSDKPANVRVYKSSA